MTEKILSKATITAGCLMIYLFAWVLQLLIIGILMLLGNCILYGLKSNESILSLIFLIAQYVVAPASVIYPSIIINYSADKLEEKVLHELGVLRLFQPSLIIGAILFFGVGLAEVGWRFPAIIVAIAGYSPMIYKNRHALYKYSTKLKKSDAA